MVAEKKDKAGDRNAKGQFVQGSTIRGRKKNKVEKAQVLWTAALMRAKRKGHNSIAAWLASDKVSQKEFLLLFAKAIPRDVQVDVEATLSFEDWLADLERRAAEEQAALDRS